MNENLKVNLMEIYDYLWYEYQSVKHDISTIKTSYGLYNEEPRSLYYKNDKYSKRKSKEECNKYVESLKEVICKVNRDFILSGEFTKESIACMFDFLVKNKMLVGMKENDYSDEIFYKLIRYNSTEKSMTSILGEMQLQEREEG